MNAFFSYVLLSLGSLLAILNPLATVPPFMAMTRTNTVQEQITMARTACMIACGVLLAFTLFGVGVLDLFGVSIPAFQIAGGLILLRVAFEMLGGNKEIKVTSEEKREALEKDDISITPLGIPMLCGPGSITTGILLESQAQNWMQMVALAATIVILFFGTYWMLRLTILNSHRIGNTVVLVSSRLMGLILAALSIQFMLDGLRLSGLIPA